MNRPVVATAVGGAPELARHHPGLHLLPPDASPDAFATAILAATRNPTHPHHATPSPAETGDPRLASFSTHAMAARYRWLYQRTLAAAARNLPPAIQTSHPAAGRGFWLITNHLGTGGAQSSARRLLRELHRQGIPVRTATLLEPPDLPSPGRRELLGLGIPVLALPPPRNASTTHTIETLLDAIDADPPAAVLLWNAVPLCKLLLADALFDTPVFDVSPGEMLFDSLERYFQSPEPGLPCLSPADYGARLTGCVVKYTAETRRAADTLLTRVHVIPNGVDTRDFPTAAFHSLPESGNPPTLTFGTVARLHPHKRLPDLLNALRSATDRLPPWQLRIAGGPEPGFETHADELRDLARGLPVTWLGDVPDVAGELARWDLALVISEPAGCPNAILEAMAAALPVLATAVGGAPDLIVHEQTGWLVPPRNPDAFAEVLVRLAEAPGVRRRLGAAARQRVADRFSLDRMAAAYADLILIPAPPRSAPDTPSGPVVANPGVPS
jgi:glycosyltransferase involved in cell wall biosynthesis